MPQTTEIAAEPLQRPDGCQSHPVPEADAERQEAVGAAPGRERPAAGAPEAMEVTAEPRQGPEVTAELLQGPGGRRGPPAPAAGAETNLGRSSEEAAPAAAAGGRPSGEPAAAAEAGPAPEPREEPSEEAGEGCSFSQLTTATDDSASTRVTARQPGAAAPGGSWQTTSTGAPAGAGLGPTVVARLTSRDGGLYNIEVAVEQAGKKVTHSARRRYSEFSELDLQMRSKFPDLPSLPEKSFWRRNFRRSFRDARERELGGYVAALAEADPSASDARLRAFLRLPAAAAAAAGGAQSPARAA